jgi:hypothetical protein
LVAAGHLEKLWGRPELLDPPLAVEALGQQNFEGQLSLMRMPLREGPVLSL